MISAQIQNKLHHLTSIPLLHYRVKCSVGKTLIVARIFFL